MPPPPPPPPPPPAPSSPRAPPHAPPPPRPAPPPGQLLPPAAPRVPLGSRRRLHRTAPRRIARRGGTLHQASTGRHRNRHAPRAPLRAPGEERHLPVHVR